MVRVAALKNAVDEGDTAPDVAGLTPSQQLAQVSERAHAMVDRLYETLSREILPAPRRARHPHPSPSPSSMRAARATLARYFRDEVLPALTPLAIDTSRPFPMLAGLSLNLAVLLAPAEDEEEPRLAVVQVPSRLPRLVRPTGGGGHHLRPARRGHPRASSAPSSPAGDQGDRRLPRRPRRGAGSRRRRRARPPRGHRGGAEEPPPQRHRAPGGGGGGRRDPPAACSTRDSRWTAADIYRIPGPLDIRALLALVDLPALEDLRDPPLKPLPSVEVPRETASSRSSRSATSASTTPTSPSTPWCAFVTPGGRRPGRARDQADALPHERRLAPRAGPGPGGGERQAGHGAGGADGPLRRAANIRWARRPGGGGGPRHLRHPRVQDPRQDLPGRAPRAPGHPALRPPRHRQLQRPHRAALHRLRPA